MNDFRTARDAFIFDVVSSLCDRAGMSTREKVIFMLSGRIIPPFPWDLDAWRSRESSGSPIDCTVPGIAAMLSGKSRLESKGPLCTCRQRETAYYDSEDVGGWEGTDYWDSYPLWYTSIVLRWHPRYGVKSEGAGTPQKVVPYGI